MNQEIKAKWVDALRSGEYEQGKGFLKWDGKFCCLGVLCDLYHKETGNGQWRVGFERQWFDDQFLGLPETVQQWSSVQGKFPIVPGDIKSLATYNDGSSGDTLGGITPPHSFEQIARIIEEKF